MSDTSGWLFEMPWACWDPDSSSWRTYAGTSHSGSRKFSGTWPTSGSMRDGACYEHPTWGHPTSVPACSLLPTARVSMGHGPSQAEVDAGDPNCRLETAVAVLMLPTPTVQASKHAQPTPYERERYEAGGLDAYNLWVVVPMLFDGDRTDPPSNDGKPSTDPHQPQLPTEG